MSEPSLFSAFAYIIVGRTPTHTHDNKAPQRGVSK